MKPITQRALLLSYFIGDGTEQTFHLTNRTMTASLYELPPLLDSFINLGELTIPGLTGKG
ncbi:hypothetical protein MASR1M12_15430 [Erysipelotrichia bacterium]